MEKINFQDLPSTSTPLNSTNLNQMQANMEDAIIPIKLVTISDTAPGSATTGDMYYNTADNKVYTAIGTNTWDSGNTPRYDGFYINTTDNTLFYYNGTALVGAGGSQTSINVKNEKTTSETDVYSCNYVNNMKVNITIDGGPVKTGRIIAGKEEYIDVLNVGTGPNNAEIQVDYTTSNKFITDYYLIGISSANEIIKAPNAAALNQFFNVFFTDNKIAITSNQDRTRFTCYVYVSFIYTN